MSRHPLDDVRRDLPPQPKPPMDILSCLEQMRRNLSNANERLYLVSRALTELIEFMNKEESK